MGPKQLFTVNFVCFSYLNEIIEFSIRGNFEYAGHFSESNHLLKVSQKNSKDKSFLRLP